MWTSQVYGHHDKMARTKTHRTSQNTEYTKTQQTLRNNYFLCFSDFSGVFLFSIFNWKEKMAIHSFYQDHKRIKQNDRKVNNYKIKNQEGMKKKKNH